MTAPIPIKVTVDARFDEEAEVWIATSDDIDGLVLEDESIDRLMERIPGVLSDLIEENGLPGDEPEVSFILLAHASRQLQINRT